MLTKIISLLGIATPALISVAILNINLVTMFLAPCHLTLSTPKVGYVDNVTLPHHDVGVEFFFSVLLRKNMIFQLHVMKAEKNVPHKKFYHGECIHSFQHATI